MTGDRDVSSGLLRRRPPPQRRLIVGSRMVCPRCKRQQDILSFVPLAEIEEYAADTVTIYKCSLCRWLFAPNPV